jgi:hypothetical protein
MPAHERLDLGHQLGVDIDFEVSRDSVLEDSEMEILEPIDLGLGKVLELRIGQRGAAPERKRLAQHLRALRRLERARVSREPFETDEIELIALELEQVARRPRMQDARPEQLS